MLVLQDWAGHGSASVRCAPCSPVVHNPLRTFRSNAPQCFQGQQHHVTSASYPFSFALGLTLQVGSRCLPHQVAENHTKILAVNKRLNVAKAKVDKIVGTKKATKVFSSAKYPGPKSLDDFDNLYGDGVNKGIRRKHHSRWHFFSAFQISRQFCLLYGCSMLRCVGLSSFTMASYKGEYTSVCKAYQSREGGERTLTLNFYACRRPPNATTYRQYYQTDRTGRGRVNP
jgi:hypothetical protein